jgi:hypothetical protein
VTQICRQRVRRRRFTGVEPVFWSGRGRARLRPRLPCTSEILKELDPAAGRGGASARELAARDHDGVWFNSAAWIFTARRH